MTLLSGAAPGEITHLQVKMAIKYMPPEFTTRDLCVYFDQDPEDKEERTKMMKHLSRLQRAGVISSERAHTQQSSVYRLLT